MNPLAWTLFLIKLVVRFVLVAAALMMVGPGTCEHLVASGALELHTKHQSLDQETRLQLTNHYFQ